MTFPVVAAEKSAAAVCMNAATSAGLLEHWRGPDGEVATFAILTTAANALMAPIHDRMPVIVQPEDYAAWLDPSVTDSGLVREFGRAVGNSRAQGPELIEPVEGGRV